MTQNNKTVNVRINNSTHEELKTLCQREGMLIGRLVDKVLTKHITDWKANNITDAKTANSSNSE